MQTGLFFQSFKAWLHYIFLEDWVTKTVALLITLVIWYGVTGSRAPTTMKMRGVHLSFRLPGDTEISNEVIVDEVEVTVTGDKNRIDRINPRDLVVVADLSGFKSGDLVVQLKPETVNLELPSGIKLEGIEPNKISLKIEQRIEKLVEVRPSFVGELPAGFEIYETLVTPARVRVRGAESRINALDRVPTERIDLNTKTESFIEKQITVDLLDPKITVLDAVIDVAVSIGAERTAKVFADVRVVEPGGAKTMPEVGTVTLFGARKILDNLAAEDLQIELNTSDDGSITPRVLLPAEFLDKIQIRAIKPNGFSIVK